MNFRAGGGAVTLALCVLLAHWTALTTYFAVDDFGALAKAGALHWPTPVEVVATRFFSQDLFFTIVTHLLGATAVGFHAIGLALHAVNAWLLHSLLRREAIGFGPAVAVAGAVLFAVHPASHTALVWVSAAFNELPVVTFVLLAAGVELDYVEHGGVWRVLAIFTLMAVALGFKQPAICGWAYLGALGFVATRASDSRTHRVRLARAALTLVPGLLMTGWLVVAILPRMREIYTGPYEPVFAPPQMLHAGLRLAAQVLNPLPLLRAALGAQPSVGLPWSDAPALVALTRAFIVATVAGSAWWLARAERRMVVLGAWASACVASWLWALPLVHHLEDYYVYLSLPAAATVLALPAARLVTGLSGCSSPVRWTAGIIGFVAIAGTDAWLSATNRVVGEAGRAHDLVRAVSGRPGRPTLICFLPPNDAAYVASTYGAALTVARPETSVAALFPGRRQDPSCWAATPTEWMASFEQFESSRWGIVWLDQAQWVDTGARLALEPGQSVRQAFRVSTDDVQGVDVWVEWRGRACEVDAAVVERDAPAREMGHATWSCREIPPRGFTRLPVSGLVAGIGYELRLGLTGVQQNGVAAVAVSPTPAAHFAALDIEPSHPTPDRSDASRTLVYRVVLSGR